MNNTIMARASYTAPQNDFSRELQLSGATFGAVELVLVELQLSGARFGEFGLVQT